MPNATKPTSTSITIITAQKHVHLDDILTKHSQQPLAGTLGAPVSTKQPSLFVLFLLFLSLGRYTGRQPIRLFLFQPASIPFQVAWDAWGDPVDWHPLPLTGHLDPRWTRHSSVWTGKNCFFPLGILDRSAADRLSGNRAAQLD